MRRKILVAVVLAALATASGFATTRKSLLELSWGREIPPLPAGAAQAFRDRSHQD